MRNMVSIRQREVFPGMLRASGRRLPRPARNRVMDSGRKSFFWESPEICSRARPLSIIRKQSYSRISAPVTPGVPSPRRWAALQKQQGK